MRIFGASGAFSACGILGTQEAPPKYVDVSVIECVTDSNSQFLPHVVFRKKTDECGNESIYCRAEILNEEIVGFSGVGAGNACTAKNQSEDESVQFELAEDEKSIEITLEGGETRSISCRSGVQEIGIDDREEGCGDAARHGGFFEGSLDYCRLGLEGHSNGQSVEYFVSMTHKNSAESTWLEGFCSKFGDRYDSKSTLIPNLDPGSRLCYLRSSKFDGAELLAKGVFGASIACSDIHAELIDGFGGEEVTQALLEDLP